MHKIFKKVIFILTLLFLSILIPFSSYAQDVARTIAKGEIVRSEKTDCSNISEIPDYICIKYLVKILDGEFKGDEVETMVTVINSDEDIFRDGKKVYLSETLDLENNPQWTIESYSREGGLILLFGVFLLLILLVSGIRGLRASVGLFVSFLVLYSYSIPRINDGGNIVIVAIVSVIVLLFAATFLTYGMNIKSLIAFVSTLLGVIIVFVLGYVIVRSFGMNGSGEESAYMLYDTTSGIFKLSSVYLLGIVIGSLGVLDDLTVGQTSSMLEIYNANRGLKASELYRKVMNIGKDHISSMVNTLFIAYAGSSFTLVMLLSANNPDFRILINTEFIVEELVRALVASIGLILIVPVTSFIASRIIVRYVRN